MSTRIPGYIIRDGKLVEKPKRVPVSERCRQRGSKKISVAKAGTATIKVESLADILDELKGKRKCTKARSNT